MIIKKKLTLVLVILISIGIIGCTTSDIENKNSNYVGNNKVAIKDSTESNSMKNAVDSMLNANDYDLPPEVTAMFKGMMQQVIDNPDAFAAEMEKLGKSMLYVSPNPTSSSVTVEFFHQQAANKLPFPELTLDLYFEGKKIQTFNYTNVSGSVVIPEKYLQQAGTYTVVVDFFKNGNPISKSFVVTKQ